MILFYISSFLNLNEDLKCLDNLKYQFFFLYFSLDAKFSTNSRIPAKPSKYQNKNLSHKFLDAKKKVKIQSKDKIKYKKLLNFISQKFHLKCISRNCTKKKSKFLKINEVLELKFRPKIRAYFRIFGNFYKNFRSLLKK